MHHIYHTEGIILGSRNFGESGRYYFILTKDLGMLRASASGVRKMSSKLRFILQDSAYVRVDLVRGRDFWRITSGSKTNSLENLPKNKGAHMVFVNISRLLRRLLSGEESNETLFTDLLLGLSVLEKYSTKEDLANIEAVLVLRILHNLGYIGGSEELKTLTKSPFESDLVYEAAKSRVQILREINKALKETHL